jgi:hypothetical protein
MQIHSDQGENFQSKIFTKVCELLSIDKTRTTSFRPQSNGNVERFHRTLATMLTMYIAKEQNRWDEYLSQIMMAYRSSKQSSTGQIPNMLTLPLQVVVESPKEILEAANVNEYGQDMQTRMHLAHEIARQILKRKTQYQKRYYDTKSRKILFTSMVA